MTYRIDEVEACSTKGIRAPANDMRPNLLIVFDIID
jgi:hypothetical protein|tara:strand:- start:2508 stop:2615 length:108 start_codon:yes stop_codon:yes gene_type:complete